jgi:hypothetical protein
MQRAALLVKPTKVDLGTRLAVDVETSSCSPEIAPVSQMRVSSGNAAQLAPGASRRVCTCACRHAMRPAVAVAARQQQHMLTALKPAAPAAWTQLMQRGSSAQQRRLRSITAASATAEAPEETFQYQAEVRRCIALSTGRRAGLLTLAFHLLTAAHKGVCSACICIPANDLLIRTRHHMQMPVSSR